MTKFIEIDKWVNKWLQDMDLALKNKDKHLIKCLLNEDEESEINWATDVQGIDLLFYHTFLRYAYRILGIEPNRNPEYIKQRTAEILKATTELVGMVHIRGVDTTFLEQKLSNYEEELHELNEVINNLLATELQTLNNCRAHGTY